MSRHLKSVLTLSLAALFLSISSFLVWKTWANSQAGKPSLDHRLERAAALFDGARRNTDMAEKLPMFCEALSSIGEALREQPFNSRVLVSWASIRQLLGSYTCTAPFTEGDFREALALGLQQNPTDSSVLYEAAKIYLWSGEKAQAFKILRDALQFDIGFGPAQQQFIVSLLRSPDDLRAIVPPRFPQVVKWSQLMFRKYPARAEKMLDVLSDLQRTALETSKEEYQRDAIPEFVYSERLASLSGLALLRDDIRRAADLALAQMVQNRSPKQSSYLGDRANRPEISVVRTALRDDLRPVKSVLGRWGYGESVCADEYLSTVGFFLPPGGEVHLLELRSSRTISASAPDFIKIYVSHDNQEWKEQPAENSTIRLDASGENLAFYRVPALQYRYWKLHFSGARRTPEICHKLDEMLRVYGRSE